MSAADAYFSFEDRFRGPEALILERLKHYGALLEAFRPDSGEGSAHLPLALDLGCGRGEWLDLLRSYSWPAEGVDGNTAMVEHCRTKGHRVRCADGLADLRSRSVGSLACISAFHLIEHLPHRQLEQLLCLGHSRLEPQGLLILETPNCDTIRVATGDFHLDPTHTTRIHRLFLEHRLRTIGFEVVVTIGLNGRSLQEDWPHPSLRDVLESGAPDLAIVASPRPEPWRRQAMEQWALAHDCWSGVQIGDRFEERIRSLEQHLNRQERELEAMRALVSQISTRGSWRQRLRHLTPHWFGGA